MLKNLKLKLFIIYLKYFYRGKDTLLVWQYYGQTC